jgi:hypothetical protein
MKKIMNCCKPNIKYTKLVTGGNDPTLSKRMRYSQYVNNTRPARLVSTPVKYVNQANLFIEKYILLHNNITINLDNFIKFVQQYQLKKSLDIYFNIDDFNNLIDIMNTWIQEYKKNNGVNISINKFNLFIDDLNQVLQQFSENNGIYIIIDNLYIENMTTKFINNNITDEVYYNYLNKIFINLDKNNLSELLNGILPLLPREKAFYLKRYVEKVDPFGSIWPHHNPDQPIKTNINFMNYN